MNVSGINVRGMNVSGKSQSQVNSQKSAMVCCKRGKRGHIARDCHWKRDTNGTWIGPRRQFCSNGPSHNMTGEGYEEAVVGATPGPKASANSNARGII